MKKIFRSRLPQPLTPTQLDFLTEQSRLPSEDIQEWYERFNHCYPRGYLSSKEFITYLKQFHTQHRTATQPTKSVIKQHFRVLDLNEDKQLNFEEFFLFNLLINQGTNEEKFKLLLTLYDKDQTKYLTKQQMENVLINMFDLLNMPKSKNGLTQKLNTILSRGNFNIQNGKYSWNTFSSYVLNNQLLLRLLISNDIEENIPDDDESPWIVTRF